MAFIEFSIVSKGEYDSGKNPAYVYPKQYVFLKNRKKEKFLSLRFFNGLTVSVTYLEFILFQLDSAGNVIKKARIRENITGTAPGKTFALPSGIKLCDKCVDFKIQMVEARSGKYVYSLKHRKTSPMYLIDEKWKYDPENQGYFSKQSVRSKMQKDFFLVKFLTVMAIIAMIGTCLFPIIKFLIEQLM